MDPRIADRLVLRALAGAETPLTLPGLHTAVALDPDSASLQPFGAQISAALVRLLMSGEVDVEQDGVHLVYLLRHAHVGHGAVA